VRAAAGSGSFHREPRLRELLSAAEARVAQLKAAVGDQQGPRNRNQAAALAAVPDAQARKQRNKGDPEQARTSTTDAEARVMKMPDGGFRPAYNVQVAAETRHGLVVGAAVTTSGADQDALEGMHAQVTAAYG